MEYRWAELQEGETETGREVEGYKRINHSELYF